jgi:hypothetical protein
MTITLTESNKEFFVFFGVLEMNSELNLKKKKTMFVSHRKFSALELSKMILCLGLLV